MLAAAHCVVKRHRPRAASSDYATAWPPWKPTESTPRLRLQLLPELRDVHRAHREGERDGGGPTSLPHKLSREHRGRLGRPWLPHPAACHLLARPLQRVDAKTGCKLSSKKWRRTRNMNSHMATAMLAKEKEFRIKFRLWGLEPPSPVIERRRLRTRRQNQAPNQSTPFYQPSGPREFSCIDGHCNSLFVVGRLCVRTSLSGIIRFGSAISSRFFVSMNTFEWVGSSRLVCRTGSRVWILVQFSI